MLLSEIKHHAQDIDADQLHLYLIEQVKSGKHDTCLDAFVEYVEENDVNLEKINKYISQPLKAILYKEAVERNLIKNSQKSLSLEDFF